MTHRNIRGTSVSVAARERCARISELKKERNALLLAHNYQRPEVQDAADYTGDSLELALRAMDAPERVIVFCGVLFMAETVSILCPEKTVLLPVKEAGCALADTATAAMVRRERSRHPDAVVVAYVNTSAEVKAESDICCTSANAAEIVAAVNPVRPVIFVSDKNLGHYAGIRSGRCVILWKGMCPPHGKLSIAEVRVAKERHAGAAFIAHPECPPAVLKRADYVGGTAGMLGYVGRNGENGSYIVGTDPGMIHRLKKDYPDKTFHPVSPGLVCPTMKLTTLADIEAALEENKHAITVEASVRGRARRALEAMLAFVRCRM